MIAKTIEFSSTPVLQTPTTLQKYMHFFLLVGPNKGQSGTTGNTRGVQFYIDSTATAIATRKCTHTAPNFELEQYKL